MRGQIAFLCCCNIAWIIYNAGNSFSCEHFFALLCYLSTLYLIANLEPPHTPPPPHAPPVVEEAGTTLLRKQIQEVNWKILSSKASTLSLIKEVTNRGNERFRRCVSDRSQSMPTGNHNAKLRPWHSFNESNIPELHSMD